MAHEQFVSFNMARKGSQMKTENDGLDLVWGLAAISKVIGRTSRQTHYMLSTGKLPARQVGNRWVAERSNLIAFFSKICGAGE